jgi:hypothetical protein
VLFFRNKYLGDEYMGNDLAKPEQFSVVKVDAQVSMDDVLDSKVWEYEKKLMALNDEVTKDSAAIKKNMSALEGLLDKSFKTTGFKEHVVPAKRLLKQMSLFADREVKMFDVVCSGEYIKHEKQPSVVRMRVDIVDKNGGCYISRKIIRDLTPEEVQWFKDLEKAKEDLQVNEIYLADLDKAKVKIPLIRRELKNRVVRKKLEAAGETKLLDSIDAFEIPVMPKNVGRHKI